MGLRKEELLPCLGIDLGQRSLSMTRPLSVSQSVKEKDRPFGRSGARQDEGVTALKPVLKQQVRMQTLASVWRNREWQYLFKTCLSGGMGGTKQNKKKLGLPEAGLEEVGETKLGFGFCSSNSGEPLVSRAVGELGDLAARPVWPCTGGEILTTSYL